MRHAFNWMVAGFCTAGALYSASIGSSWMVMLQCVFVALNIWAALS